MGETNRSKKILNNENDGTKVISGYAIKFNEKSKLLGNFYEVIDEHALDNVNLSDVKCLVDHDFSKVLGRTLSDTLSLSIDKVGLHFECKLANTSYANDLYELIARADVNECSFGFTVDETDKTAQTITRDKNGVLVRHVKKIDKLYEVSIVSLPAYSNTSAEIKRDFETAQKQFELEKLSLEFELLNL